MYMLGMATVILKWNPAISSYTLGRSDHGFEQAREEKNYMLNWSGKGRITYYADTATERFSGTGSACTTCATFSRVTGISKTTARAT